MRSPDSPDERRRLRATRELAHSATALASEAANFARIFGSGDSDASQAASRASITAAEIAFTIDERLHRNESPADWAGLARETLQAATSAIEAAMVAVKAASSPSEIQLDEVSLE